MSTCTRARDARIYVKRRLRAKRDRKTVESEKWCFFPFGQVTCNMCEMFLTANFYNNCAKIPVIFQGIYDIRSYRYLSKIKQKSGSESYLVRNG